MADRDLISHIVGASTGDELIHFMVGDLIAKGSMRWVYDLPFMPGWVIKFEPGDARNFANVEEWATWSEFKHNPHVGPWLAPCHSISYNGNWLIQARTKEIKRLPDKLPAFLGDFKAENFGRYKGRIVAHDYANNDFRWTGTTTKMLDRKKELLRRARVAKDREGRKAFDHNMRCG